MANNHAEDAAGLHGAARVPVVRDGDTHTTTDPASGLPVLDYVHDDKILQLDSAHLMVTASNRVLSAGQLRLAAPGIKPVRSSTHILTV